MDINADVQRALDDWDRAWHRGVCFGCRYEEEYSDDAELQGVSRTLTVAAKKLETLSQGDTITKVTTLDGRTLGPYTIETVERDTDATARLRLRGT